MGLIRTNEIHSQWLGVSCWWHWRLHFHLMDRLSVVIVLLVWRYVALHDVHLACKLGKRRRERKRSVMKRWRKGEVEMGWINGRERRFVRQNARKKEWIESLKNEQRREESGSWYLSIMTVFYLPLPLPLSLCCSPSPAQAILVPLSSGSWLGNILLTSQSGSSAYWTAFTQLWIGSPIPSQIHLRPGLK